MEIIPDNDEDLGRLARSLSLAEFHLPFLHVCRYNKRLRSIGGRYLLSSHVIEINYQYAVAVGRSGLILVLKHELCHYHLHLQGKGYRHKDKEFRQLLSQVMGARYAEASALCIRPYRYEYRCSHCGYAYLRKNRLNLGKFVCGRCHGKLRLIENSVMIRGGIDIHD